MFVGKRMELVFAKRITTEDGYIALHGRPDPPTERQTSHRVAGLRNVWRLCEKILIFNFD